jgi:hypothetical protein
MPKRNTPKPPKGHTEEPAVRVDDAHVEILGPDLGEAPNLGDVAPVPQHERDNANRPAANPEMRRARPERTARAAAGIAGDARTAAMQESLRRNMAGVRDEIDDAEARRRAGLDAGGGRAPNAAGLDERPAPPQNLPDVIRRAVFARRQANQEPDVFDPEWHQVRALPGYLGLGGRNGEGHMVRALGRDVFRQFTDVPLEDIAVLANLRPPGAGAGVGPNTLDDVQKMAYWISRNGIRDDRVAMDFAQVFGAGANAEVQVWNTDQHTFVIVRDFAGHYVYGMPGGRGVHLENNAPAARIGEPGHVVDVPPAPARLAAPAPAAPREVAREVAQGARAIG